jgi:hypothetical protein
MAYSQGLSRPLDVTFRLYPSFILMLWYFVVRAAVDRSKGSVVRLRSGLTLESQQRE